MIILVLVYAGWFLGKSRILSFLVEKISAFNKNDPRISIALYISINVALSWLPIPGLTYINICIAVLRKDAIGSFLIFFGSTFGAAIVCYFGIKYYIKDWMLKKYQENLVFKVFREEVKKNP